jgi:hypothetical protein
VHVYYQHFDFPLPRQRRRVVHDTRRQSTPEFSEPSMQQELHDIPQFSSSKFAPQYQTENFNTHPQILLSSGDEFINNLFGASVGTPESARAYTLKLITVGLKLIII